MDFPIVAVTGAEVITGSTRMKSGTAQKMICNMISTSAMIKMGKVYENLMIDVKATNEKLVSRGINIICSILDVDKDEAAFLLDKYKTIKKVIFSSFTGEENIDKIDLYLDKTKGNIRKSIKLYKENENEN